MAGNTAGSILAVDFGSVHTRVVLFDLVEGAYRLIARGETHTTDGYPATDIAVGLDRVLRLITEATGHKLTDESGRVISPESSEHSGVDVFAITASIGRPLRAVIVGLIPGVSIESAVRAASGTYIQVAEIISLDDGRTDQERLNVILLNYPDVIIIAGGTEGGAKTGVVELAKIVRLAVMLTDKRRQPTVVFAGNSALQGAMVEMFGELVPLLMAENVRPALDNEHVEDTRSQLGRAFDRYKEARSQSFARISEMSTTGVLPTGQSYTIIANYLDRITPGGVALLDLGSASSTLAASVNDRVTTSIRTDIGLGHSAPNLVATVGLPMVRQWIPFNIPDTEILNYALNKSLYTGTVPMTLRELYIEHALVRAGGRIMQEDANPEWRENPPQYGMIVGGGAALSNTGHPGYDALLLLDIMQPMGVTVLQTDPYGMIPAMGAIAGYSPEAVVQLLENGSLNLIGTCISLSGIPRREKTAMQIEITLDDGEEIEQTVSGGHLWVYPLPAHKTAEIRVKCMAGTSVNNKRSVKLTARGGMVGLIFDARGRTMALPANVGERAELFPAWVHEMTGHPLIEINPEWLQVVEEEKIEAETVAKGQRSTRRKEVKQKADQVVRKTAERKASGKKGKAGTGESKTLQPDDDLDALFDTGEIDLGKDETDELDELRDVLS